MKNGVVLWGFIMSVLCGISFGWPILLVGLVVGIVSRLLSGWRDVLAYAVGVLLFLPILIIGVLLRP